MIGAGLGALNAAISGHDPGRGALTGAITGGFLGGANGFGLVGDSLTNACAAAGAASGAINAAISGSSIINGAFWGGTFGAASNAIGTPNFKPFGNSAGGSILNRFFNSSLTGAAFGAVSAGMTGGSVLQGAAMGAAGWAVGEGANMLVGHIVGFARSGAGPTYDSANGVFVYDGGSGGAVTFSNVISGPKDFLVSPLTNYAGTVTDPNHTVYQHEIGHTPGGTLLGPAYILSNVLSLAVGGLVGAIGGFGFYEGTHRFNIFERTLQPVPYPVGP